MSSTTEELIRQLEGALVNSEGQDFHIDAGFVRTLILHLRASGAILQEAQDALMMKAQQCTAERLRANAAERDLAKERCR